MKSSQRGWEEGRVHKKSTEAFVLPHTARSERFSCHGITLGASVTSEPLTEILELWRCHPERFTQPC